MAFTNNSRASLDSVLKSLYASGVAEAIYKKFPAFALIKKDTSLEGKDLRVPISFGHGGSPSASVANAMSNAGPALWEDWVLTPSYLYQPSGIDGSAIDSIRTNRGAFVAKVASVTDKALLAVGQTLNAHIFRNSGGLGIVSSYGSGTGPNSSDKITLTQAGDIHSFEVGNVLVVTNGASEVGSLRTGYFTVQYVNRAGGWIAGVAGGTLSGVTANDNLILQGCAANAGASVALRGFDAWIPTGGTPTYGQTFFGVERSVDNRLYGGYISTAYTMVEEALIDCAGYAGLMGGEPDTCFLHPIKFATLVKQLGSKVCINQNRKPQGSKGEVETEIGFSSIQLHGPTGPVDVMQDRQCPATRAYMLDSAQVTLHSSGEPIKFSETPEGSKWFSQITQATPVDGFFVLAKSTSCLSIAFPGSCSSVLMP